MTCTYTHTTTDRCSNCGGTIRFTINSGTTSSNYFTFPVVRLPQFVLPRNWRWFHSFAEALPPAIMRLTGSIREELHRVQERYPVGQRTKWKRRRFVQACSR